MYIRWLTTFLVFAFTISKSIAQDVDLFKVLEEENKKDSKNKTDYTSATFKTTRLINGHSVETIGKRILDVKISHRFNQLSNGIYNLFGLDNATMRMGLDYGITNRLMIGAGRSTFEKQYDGFVKYKLLRQAKGFRNMPVTITLVATAMLATDTAALRSRYLSDYPEKPVDTIPFSAKMFYSYQVIIARKFSDNTSLQVMPTLVHYNMVRGANDPNDIVAIGVGGRQKVSKRVSVNAEYYYVLPGQKLKVSPSNNQPTHNSLAVGVDIETGGHVFQLHFTNSHGMTERTFITETTGDFFKGDIGFGFNISRVFVIGGKKKKSADKAS